MSQRYEGAVRALSKVMAELTEARAENRRLRRALTKCADGSFKGWECMDIARAALSPRPRTTNRTTKAPAKPGRKA